MTNEEEPIPEWAVWGGLLSMFAILAGIILVRFCADCGLAVIGAGWLVLWVCLSAEGS